MHKTSKRLTRPPADPLLLETVRQNLIRFRKELHLTTPAAAIETGVPIDSLRRYEARGTLETRVLKKFAAAYGRPMMDFYKTKPPPARPDTRPAFYLRVRDGAVMNQPLYEELVAIIADANRRYLEALMKKRHKR